MLSRIFLCILCLLPFSANAVHIVQKVGTEIISDADVEERAKTMAAINRVEITPKLYAMLENMALNDLIDETIFLTEASSLGLNISPSEINRAVDMFCKNAHFDKSKLVDYINKYGGKFESLELQIKARLLWNKILDKKFGYLFDISEGQIRTYINEKYLSKIRIVNVSLFHVPSSYSSDVDKIVKVVFNHKEGFLSDKYPDIKITSHEMQFSELQKTIKLEFADAKKGKVAKYEGDSGDWLVVRLNDSFFISGFTINETGKIKVISAKYPDVKCVAELKALSKIVKCNNLEKEVSKLSCKDDVSIFEVEAKIGELAREQSLLLSDSGYKSMTKIVLKDGFATGLMFCQSEEFKKLELAKNRDLIYKEKLKISSKPFLSKLRSKYLPDNQFDLD